MDFKGFKILNWNQLFAQNSSTHSNIAQNTSLKWMWWEHAATWICWATRRNRNCHLSRHRSHWRPRRSLICELPIQFSVVVLFIVECKDGGAAADVALLLLMWRPPNGWALPYGSYCQPRGSGQSWLMLGDTTNVDSLLMWILPIILMWTGHP